MITIFPISVPALTAEIGAPKGRPRLTGWVLSHDFGIGVMIKAPHSYYNLSVSENITRRGPTEEYEFRRI